MKKVGIITQARMTSTRLRGKVLLKIDEKTVLDYHIERLQQSGIKVFVATTTNHTDDPIVEFCQQRNLSFYRGSEENVLSRFFECAVQNQLEVVVRVTSDCPLIDGNLVKSGVATYLQQNNPRLYLSNVLERTFPRGFDFEVFSFELLEEAFENATLPMDLEHVTPYIHQKRAKNVAFHSIKKEKDDSHLRLTLDTPEDFQLIETLVKTHRADLLDYAAIIEILNQNPALVQINQHIEQKKL